MQSRFSLKNIILMTLISIICGVVFYSVSFLEDAIRLALMPFGLSIMAADISQGPWLLTAPLVGLLFRFPGSAFFGQLMSSIVEMFMGDQGGWTDLLSGVFDGAGYEVGFGIMRYRRYNYLTIILASFMATVSTFIYSWFMNGYNKLSISLLIVCFIVRFISILIFSFIAYFIDKKVLQVVRIKSSKS